MHASFRFCLTAAAAALLGLAILTPGCGETSPSSSSSTSSSPAGSSSHAAPKTSGSTVTSASAATAPPAPIPPELRAKLDAGASCKWSEEGLMQSCSADEALKTYIKANHTAATLDGCLAAVQDKAAAIRVMAASCLYQYYFGMSDVETKPTGGKLFDVILVAIENETDPGVRAALGTAIWQRDALSVDKADAVIATLKKLDPAKDGKAMSFIVNSLYSWGMKSEPIKEALDLAPTFAASPSAALRQDAYSLMGYARSRADTFCPILRKAIEEDSDKWTDALSAYNNLRQACEKEADAVQAAIVNRLERAADPDHKPAEEILSWGEMRSYVKAELRTPEQREAIAKAADKVAKGAKTSETHKGYAKTLADDARAKKDK